jgi:quinol-cytochrome oxidoreductase complex cytochrome b subunit
MKKHFNKSALFRRLALAVLVVFAVILAFAFIDFLIHSSSEEYAVPSYYFRNKIIFGTIIGLITYYIIRKTPLLAKALLFSAIVSVLLQIRYFLEGYPIKFVVEFLFIHFAILLPLSLLAFYLFRKRL